MASTAQHLAIAASINARHFKFEGNDLTEFFLGAIACDAPKLKPKNTIDKTSATQEIFLESKKFPDEMRKAGRNYSHFLPGSIVPENQSKFISPEITEKYGYTPVDDRPNAQVDYTQFAPMTALFLDKYADKMSEPFMLGYLTHLITDELYFTKLVPEIVEANQDSIKEYIDNKYGKYGYEKKETLTNAEYLDWSHDALYGVFDDYNYLSLFETYDIFPDLLNLGNYLEKWEISDRQFKPSMVEDLNDSESIIAFLKNPRISHLVCDAKQQLSDSNIITRQNLSFKGLWPYNLYLDLTDWVDDEINNYLTKKVK